jgi:hypothetical protein
MLGEPGTTAYTAWAPVVNDTSGKWHGKDRFAFGEDEPAGAAVVTARKCRSTTFVAIHEPFRTHHRIGHINRVTQNDQSVVVKVVAFDDSGSVEFIDYLMLQLGDDWAKPTSVGNSSERFTFSNYAYVRLTGDGLDKNQRVGELRDMKLAEDATVHLKPALGPIAARWLPESAVCLSTGGMATRSLRLRNAGPVPVTTRVQLKCSAGLNSQPAVIEIKDLAAGAELNVPVRFSAAEDTKNRILRARLESRDPFVETQPAELLVSHGVTAKRSQVWPGDFAYTMFSPRYTAKVYYMEAGATALLLDPQGLRRSDSSGASYPQIVRHGADDRGRAGWHAENVRNFPYFIPVVVPGGGNQPAYLYEAGWHAHGRRSAVEHRFTEDWIVVRFLESTPGERISFGWHPQSRRNSLDETIVGRDDQLAAEKMPGKVLVAAADGTLHDAGDPEEWPRRADLPREVTDIAAVFHRPHGYQYGNVMLYPQETRRDKSVITQPGDQPMAFTFCTEKEFPEFVKKWRNNPPHREATQEERRIYGAAFMPHLEKGE